MSRQSSILELRNALSSVIVGQQNLLDRLIIGLLADGHVLVEGLPGLAKTSAVKTLGAAIPGSLRRIKLTPTCCPVTSPAPTSTTRASSSSSRARCSTKIILAEEINRAPAKV